MSASSDVPFDTCNSRLSFTVRTHTKWYFQHFAATLFELAICHAANLTCISLNLDFLYF